MTSPIPFQILHHSSLSWHITPLKILRSNIFYFGQKDPMEVPILTFSSDLVKICRIPHVIFQTISQFFLKFSIILQGHEKYLLCTFFSSNNIYTLFKRSPLKWKLLRLSSALVKICQIPHGNFETTSRFLSKFCITLQCHER